MNVSVNLDNLSFRNRQFFTVNSWTMAPVLRAVGARFKLLTLRNFSQSGLDRPEPWPPLSKRYAKRVKRSHATLYKTGLMYRSFTVGPTNGDSITVSCEVPYSSYHVEGTPRMPRRSPFPVGVGGNLTPLAQRQLETAAALAIQEQFRKAIR